MLRIVYPEICASVVKNQNMALKSPRFLKDMYVWVLKNKIPLFLLFGPVIALIVVYVAPRVLSLFTLREIVNLLVVYAITGIFLYFLVSAETRAKIRNHQGLVTIVGILVPVIMLLSQSATNLEREYIKKEVLLKEENNRNNSHLRSIITDLSRDPGTIFWRDFSVDNYKIYWDHIQFTKSPICRDLYASLTIQFGILNNINQLRQRLLLMPNRMNEVMLSAASSTLPILDRVVGECQTL